MKGAQEFKVERVIANGTLTDQVCEKLTELINGEGFQAGVRLPSETEMASRFGVSRTVIREAVSRLKSEGLVESRQGSGVFVREKNMDSPFRIDPSAIESVQSYLHVIELRVALEGEIAFLAAKRRTEKQMAAIEEALDNIEMQVIQGSDGAEEDIAFHRTIAEATDNPHFLSLIEFLFNFLRSSTQTTRRYEATDAALGRQVRSEHQKIVKAILQQKPEEARLAAWQHMEAVSERLLMMAKQSKTVNLKME